MLQRIKKSRHDRCVFTTQAADFCDEFDGTRGVALLEGTLGVLDKIDLGILGV